MHEYAVRFAVTFVVTRPKILLKIGCKSLFTMGGGETQNRTGDTRIFSPLLYRLSYFAESPKDTNMQIYLFGSMDKQPLEKEVISSKNLEDDSSEEAKSVRVPAGLNSHKR